MGEVVEKKIVFISGASDVYEEMDTIKDVIESINKVFCPPLKITLEAAMGSTHARMGASRPQSRINPWVEKCDLFIGIYKKRFGTETGKYDSGSEEEFKIAFDMNQSSDGHPEILLFFCHLPNQELKDIGPQLQKLLNFKEDIRQHVLYKTYSDKYDLIFNCYEQVIQWIYEFQQIGDKYYNTPTSKEVMK